MTQNAARPPSDILGLYPREWSVIAVALAIAALPAVMPVMVGALTHQFGLRVDQAGFVISANMAGILLGALCCPILLRRLSERAMLSVGLLIMIAGNMLTLFAAGFPSLVTMRLLSGWGEGLAAAVGYALMGRTHLPGRTVANYAGGQALVGAVGMAVLPGLTTQFGAAAFYGPISVLALVSLLAVRSATNVKIDPPTGPRQPRLSASGGPLAVLAALFAHYAGMTTAWAFLQRIGTDHGLSGATVALVLSVSSIAALLGSLVASFLARRLSTPASLAIGMVLTLGCGLGLPISGAAAFTGTACLISFTWAAQYPFMFRRLAELDRQGRWATLTPVATASALTAGPAIGGVLLQRAGIGAVDAAFLFLTLAGLAITAATYLRRVSAAP